MSARTKTSHSVANATTMPTAYFTARISGSNLSRVAVSATRVFRGTPAAGRTGRRARGGSVPEWRVPGGARRRWLERHRRIRVAACDLSPSGWSADQQPGPGHLSATASTSSTSIVWRMCSVFGTRRGRSQGRMAHDGLRNGEFSRALCIYRRSALPPPSASGDDHRTRDCSTGAHAGTV